MGQGPATSQTQETLQWAVGSWVGIYIPVWIEQHESVGSDKIDATAACFRRQKKHEIVLFQIVEHVDQFLPLRQTRGAIQPDAAKHKRGTMSKPTCNGLGGPI